MPESITRDELLAEACAIASTHGIAALTIRGLAKRCGVSIGTVYRHFSSKSELSVAAIESFFRRELFDDFCLPAQGRNYLAYCRLFADRISDVMARFRSQWLGGAEALPEAERIAAKKREQQLVGHILAGLARVFEEDPDINHAALPSGVTGETMSALVFDAVVAQIHSGHDADVLLYLLERGLYRA